MTRRKVEKQVGQKIDKNRLEYWLDFIQKNFSKKENFCFRKRNIFFTDPSKINQFFFLNSPNIQVTYNQGLYLNETKRNKLFYLVSFSYNIKKNEYKF